MKLYCMPVKPSERANVLLFQSLDKHLFPPKHQSGHVGYSYYVGYSQWGTHIMAANLGTYNCSIYQFPMVSIQSIGRNRVLQRLKPTTGLCISLLSVWKVVNSPARDAWKLERRITLFYYNNIIHSSFSASCPNKCFFHSSFAFISEGNSERFMEGKCCVMK